VDYCLVPRQETQTFVALAQAFMKISVPNYSRGCECTGIISHQYLDRLHDMLNEARARGCQIVPLEPDGHINRESRRMPLFLVIDPPWDLRMMREEIFGPILPIVPYDDVAHAVSMVNAGERPLGLYVFGDDQQLVESILSNTTSGGAAINACAIQGALPSLAFGGVGMSGMGRHHGIEGFREFSNPRGVVVRGWTMVLYKKCRAALRMLSLYLIFLVSRKLPVANVAEGSRPDYGRTACPASSDGHNSSVRVPKSPPFS
jgi:coniferyl-aldehyde dehydrogenase